MAKTQKANDFDVLISEFDQLIKAGKINTVQSRFSKLNLAQVPRSHRALLAKICRRSGLINPGLRLLHPIVRNDNPHAESARPDEISEYAILLSRNGSVQEALNLLESVRDQKTPEVLMSSALCHMGLWDYAGAISFLENYLLLDLDPYSKLVAKVNLASSYLATSQLPLAESLSTETFEMAKQMGSMRLAGNCLEIRSQIHFRNGDFERARLDLKMASDIFSQTQSYDLLFTQKWQAIIQGIETQTLEPLSQFRELALERKHWESVREADLFSLKVKFDQKGLDHLVYGTPMPSYRERIFQLLGRQASPTFIFGEPTGRYLDLKTGENSGVRNFNAGKKIHQSLRTLLKDFYVPRNLGSLFADLYPDEFFDVRTSGLRVRQVLWRTREWLKENRIPVVIEEHGNTYRLRIRGAFGFRLHLQAPLACSSVQFKWSQIESKFAPSSQFTSEEVCTQLGFSRTAFRQVANWAIENGLLIKTGTGKSTVYLLKGRSQNKTPSAA